MLNTEVLPYGPKINNAVGATGQLQATEYNDTQSELNEVVIESGQIFNVTKTPYQLSRSLTLKGMSASMWLEDSGSSSANVSNLIPFNTQTLIVFDKAFVAGNIIQLSINSSNIGPISFTTSNAVTFSAIQAAIQAAFPSAMVSVNSSVYASFYYISIYQSATTFTVNSITFTGTGITTPNYQWSYGNTAPDSYAEMDGAVIYFWKSVNNTSTPQINIGPIIGSLLGAVSVVYHGGGTIPPGGMSGNCKIMYNLSANYWELQYTDAWLTWETYLQSALDTVVSYNANNTINTITYYASTGNQILANTLGVKTYAYNANLTINTITTQVYAPVGTLRYTRTTTFVYNAALQITETTVVLS